MENLLKPINLGLCKNELPTNKGIYFWFNKFSGECVYIGIACNKNGLKSRIYSQHLNPNYLEFRPTKHSRSDEFQLKYAVLKKSANGSISKGIDKSSFRKSIGRKLCLKPSQETCNYILNNLILKVYEVEDEASLKAMEKEMIKKYQPIFNTSLK